MADLSLHIAAIPPPDPGGVERPPVVVSGAHRSWLRPRRSEPFAGCISMVGEAGYADELLLELEAAFRAALRYSITTSLTRSLLAAHTRLLQENRLSMPDHRRYASAVVATTRSNGLYVARSGAAVVASVRSNGAWARSGDPSIEAPVEEVRDLGRGAPPHVTSEFFPLDPGTVVLLLPGITMADISDYALARALQQPLELGGLSTLLGAAPMETAGLILWCPRTTDPRPDPGRWTEWARAVLPEPPAEDAPQRPAAFRAETVIEPIESGGAAPPSGVMDADSPTSRVDLEPALGRESGAGPGARAGTAPSRVESIEHQSGSAASVRSREARREARDAGPNRWVVPLAVGVVLALLGVLLVRGGVPGRGDGSVSAAGRLIQQASAAADQDVAAAQLAEAITILEPRAGSDEGARVLLAEARAARDRVLNVVHVSRVHRFLLPTGHEFRPGGLWKSADGLLILDLGGQLLYRTDATGTQLDVALRPGESYAGQPLGRIVTAAWSPARGTGTDSQLLVVDNQRAVMSLRPNGTAIQRWLPPDSAGWQRIGPAAATFDDLYLLDAGRGEVLRYPARTARAPGAIAVRSEQEPRVASAVDLATDGNLYLLYPDGAISKLSPSGSRLTFDSSVPDRPLQAPVSLYAHPDLERIWVLEPTAARVVELTNDGDYVRQFIFPNDLLQGAVGLHVDGRAGEMRVLAPQFVLLIQID